MNEQTAQPKALDPRTNRLLATLDRDDYDALVMDAKVVTLRFRKRIMNQDEHVGAVYFPLTAMISLLLAADGQPPVEMATIGREGVVGASELILKQGAMGLSLTQIPGVAVRIDADVFRDVIGRRPLVERLIHQHLYALVRQIMLGAACNRLHSMEERCARWLLLTHDQAGGDTFPLTQEFLSHMLGVRRATISVATGMLKKAGFIRYVRGKITVTDRPGLESASCECYQAIIRVYSDLFPSTLGEALHENLSTILVR